MFSRESQGILQRLYFDQPGLSLACMVHVKMCKVTRVTWPSDPPKIGPSQFPHPKTKFYGYLNLEFLAQVTSSLLLHPVGASILGQPFQGRLYAGMHALVLRGDQAVVFVWINKELD